MDDTWSMGFLELFENGPKITEKYGYILVVIDSSSKFCWTVRLKSENAHTEKEIFEKNLATSKQKPKLIGTNDRKEFVNKIFNEFLEKRIKNHSGNGSKRTVFAGKIIRTFKLVLQKPVLEKLGF